MKNLFVEHYFLDDSEFEDIVKDGLIVLDTNVLLDVYRYSEKTCSDIFTSMEFVKDRIWIPHQVASEFFTNRIPAIKTEIKSCEDLRTKLQDVNRTIANDIGNPFFPPEVLELFTKSTDSAIEELTKSVRTLEEFVTKRDPLLSRWTKILEGRIGSCPTDEELTHLKTVGQSRIDNGICPGTADKGKKDPTGDYVLWRQLLDKAKESNRHSIFVSRDQKKDWWIEFRDMKVGALPELRKEYFLESGGHHIVFMTMFTLLQRLEQYKITGTGVTPATIAEVKKVADLSSLQQIKIVDSYLSVNPSHDHEKESASDIEQPIKLLRIAIGQLFEQLSCFRKTLRNRTAVSYSKSGPEDWIHDQKDLDYLKDVWNDIFIGSHSIHHKEIISKKIELIRKFPFEFKARPKTFRYNSNLVALIEKHNSAVRCVDYILNNM